MLFSLAFYLSGHAIYIERSGSSSTQDVIRAVPAVSTPAGPPPSSTLPGSQQQQTFTHVGSAPLGGSTTGHAGSQPSNFTQVAAPPGAASTIHAVHAPHVAAAGTGGHPQRHASPHATSHFTPHPQSRVKTFAH